MTQTEAIERLEKWLGQDAPMTATGFDMEPDRYKRRVRHHYLDLLAGNVQAILANSDEDNAMLSPEDVVKAAAWQTEATIAALEVDK